jgi:hypothetical protein
MVKLNDEAHELKYKGCPMSSLGDISELNKAKEFMMYYQMKCAIINHDN